MRTTIPSKGETTISAEAWGQLGRNATEPWEGRDVTEIMDELRGAVELPT